MMLPLLLVAAASPAPDWKVYDSVDAVTSCNAGKPSGYDNTTCFHIGVSTSAAGCEKLIAELAASGGPAINVFTFHDHTQGPFANHCIGRTDGVWSPHGPGPGHYSGCNAAAIKCNNAPPRPPDPTPSKVPLEFECGMRAAAYRFAKHLFPSRGAFVEAFDAFELATMCNETRPAASAASSRAGWALATAAADQARRHGSAGASTSTEFHVDSSTGSDGNSGAASKPFASVERGVGACRGHAPCTVFVHASPVDYYLKQPLQLGPADSGLSIVGVPTTTGALPVLSGGVPLSGLSWGAAGGTFKPGVRKAALPAELRHLRFDQLFVDGERE